MHVVLGLHLDRERSWKKRNAFNRLVLGPSGLLSLLELYLGLSAKRPAKLQRVIQFRKILKQLDNGKRFYSRSMRVDDFGVASELLGWRDELYLRGWNGRFRGKPVSGRLADLAEVESAVLQENFAPGEGERLMQVAIALRSLRTPITSLVLLEPLERHPLRWQQVLRMLPHRFAENFQKPCAPEGSMLHVLQRSLLFSESFPDPPAIEPDGSFSVFTADTALTAAYHTGEWLREKGDDVLLVEGGEGKMLDDVLEAQGSPRQAFPAADAALPALELLALALRLLWYPLDVGALLAFLAIPEDSNPLDAALSKRLVRVVARCPGTGGAQWREALQAFRIEGGKESGAALEELNRWIPTPGKAGHAEAVPLTELALCAERVQQFFCRKKEADEGKELQALFSAGYEQATSFLAAVEELFKQGERRLGRYQIDQLLTHAAVGFRRFQEREAGSVLDASYPGAVCEQFSHVVWWWAVDSTAERPAPWAAGERLFLEREGVFFLAQKQILEWQSSDWLRPVLAAGESCTLILPPEGEERHPIWLKISSSIPSIPVLQIENPDGWTEWGRTLKVAELDLPRPRPFWSVSKGVKLSGKGFSPTSLEKFLAAPSCWFLEYVARITPSSFLDLNDGARLYGLLAHRLVQKLVARLRQEPGMPDVSEWFDAAFEKLVRTEGAVLLMPGKGAELENLRRRLRQAVLRLLPVLHEQGGGSIYSERTLEGSFHDLGMKGRADLLLFDREGEPSIIDMKWGGDRLHRSTMRQGTHVQLLAYAAMVRQETGRWPAVAYYVISTAGLLADRNRFFAFGEAVRKKEDESSEVLWQRVLTSFAWRKSQVEKGILPVTSRASEDAGAEFAFPPDGLDLSAAGDPWNPYCFLEGWEEYR